MTRWEAISQIRLSNEESLHLGCGGGNGDTETVCREILVVELTKLDNWVTKGVGMEGC